MVKIVIRNKEGTMVWMGMRWFRGAYAPNYHSKNFLTDLDLKKVLKTLDLMAEDLEIQKADYKLVKNG